MDAKQFKDILYKAVPNSDSWCSEPYGANEAFEDLVEVKKVLFCVTPTDEVVDYAKKYSYDAIISHHPFWVDFPQIILHTALDCCRGGLNWVWANYLGVKTSSYIDKNLGPIGEIEPIEFNELCSKIEELTGSSILGIKSSKIETIRSVAICTGLGGLVANEASRSGADCYILGQNTRHDLKSMFPAVIEIGHTLSERLGYFFIQKLVPDVQIGIAPLHLDTFCGEIGRTNG